MPANIETMAYAGDKPWHDLGTEVPATVTAADMIRAAGLDWEIEKRPARGAQPVRRTNGQDVYSRYELVRPPGPGTEDEEVVLGIVSQRYQPLQNSEAFDFFDPIVDRKEAFFETAGALGQGERVWVLAKLPDVIQVVRGDDCCRYLLLSNTHTGKGSVIVKFTSVRVVCQNTLVLALKGGQAEFRVRHSRRVADRLRQTAELIAATTEVFKRSEAVFKKMAGWQLTTQRLTEYLEGVFPKSAAQRRDDTQPPKWVHVERLMEKVPDLQLPGVRGTLWAAYNAITRFEDYRQVRDEVAEARLDRVWFGTSANVKLKAFTKAQELMSVS